MTIVDAIGSQFWNMKPQQILHRCGGFYRCPRTPEGKWLGPLAGFTSRDAKGRNRLGPEYANFRAISQNPEALGVVAERLYEKVLDTLFIYRDPERPLSFCGIPTGGRDIVARMPAFTSRRCFSLEKYEVGGATETGRAATDLAFGAERPRRGEALVCVEDIGNAFSTTESTVRLLEGEGAKVEAIAVFLNRSMTVHEEFRFGGREIPVIALWREPMPIYEQDDPEVAEAVRAGNVRWKPKDHWDELMRYHQAA